MKLNDLLFDDGIQPLSDSFEGDKDSGTHEEKEGAKATQVEKIKNYDISIKSKCLQAIEEDDTGQLNNILKHLLKIITDNGDDADILIRAVSDLLDIAKSASSTSGKVWLRFIPVLLAFLNTASDVIMATKIVGALYQLANNQREIRNHDGVSILLSSIKKIDNAQFRQEALAVLRELASFNNKYTEVKFRRANGIEQIIALLSTTELGVRIKALETLSSLAQSQVNQKEIRSRGGISAFVECLKSQNLELKKKAAEMLLLYEVKRIEAPIREAGCVQDLADLLNDLDQSSESYLRGRIKGLLKKFPNESDKHDDKHPPSVEEALNPSSDAKTLYNDALVKGESSRKLLRKWVKFLLSKPESFEGEAKEAFQACLKISYLKGVNRLLTISEKLLSERYEDKSAICFATHHYHERCYASDGDFKLIERLYGREDIDDHDKSQALFELLGGVKEWYAEDYSETYVSKLSDLIKTQSEPILDATDIKNRVLLMVVASHGWGKRGWDKQGTWNELFEFLFKRERWGRPYPDSNGLTTELHSAGCPYFLILLADSNHGRLSFLRQDKQGRNVFLRSLSMSHISTTEHLDWFWGKEGFSLSVRDNDGKTPLLTVASAGSSLPVVKWLLSKPGVSLKQRDNEGKSAFVYAVEAHLLDLKDRDVVLYFIKKMQKEGVSQDDIDFAQTLTDKYSGDPSKGFLLDQLKKVIVCKVSEDRRKTPERLKEAYHEAVAHEDRSMAASAFQELLSLLSKHSTILQESALKAMLQIANEDKVPFGKLFLQKEALTAKSIPVLVSLMSSKDAHVRALVVEFASNIALKDYSFFKVFHDHEVIHSLINILKNRQDESIHFEVLSFLSDLVVSFGGDSSLDSHIIENDGIKPFVELLNHQDTHYGDYVVRIIFNSDQGEYYDHTQTLFPAFLDLLDRCIKDGDDPCEILRGFGAFFDGFTGDDGPPDCAEGAIMNGIQFFTETEELLASESIQLLAKVLAHLVAESRSFAFFRSEAKDDGKDLVQTLTEKTKDEPSLSAEHARPIERLIGLLEGKDRDVDCDEHVELTRVLSRKVYALTGWEEEPVPDLVKKRAGDLVTFDEFFDEESYAYMDKQIDYSSIFVVHPGCSGSLALKAMKAFSKSYLVLGELSAFSQEALLEALSHLRCVDTLYLQLNQPLLDFINPLFSILPRGMQIVLDSEDVSAVQSFLSLLPPGFTVSIRKKQSIDAEERVELMADLPPESVYQVFESTPIEESDHKSILASLPEKVSFLSYNQSYLDSEKGKRISVRDYESTLKQRLAKEKKRPIISAETAVERYAERIAKGSTPFLYNDILPPQMLELVKVLKTRPLLVSSLVTTSCIEQLFSSGVKVKFGSQMGISEKYLCPLPYHLGRGHSLENIETPYLPPQKIPFKRLDDTIAELVGLAEKPMKRFRKKLTSYGVKMRLIKPFQGYDVTKPTVFVLAGRKERAMLPPINKGCNLVLVLTSREFESLFKDDTEEAAVLSHLQVLIIDSIHRPYKAEEDDASTITSRRLAVLLMAKNLDLDHFIMLDDNIDRVNIEGSNSFWEMYQLLLSHSQLYRQSFVSVASYSQKHKRYDQTSLGSKCHLWNVGVLKKHSELFGSNRRAWMTLMPENEDYWGQVLYAQLMLRELAGTNLATGIYPCKEMVLIRSKQTLNSTQLRGVRAKPLPFTEAYQIFLKDIDSHFFDVVRRVICIFNHQVNEQIAMNKDRIERMLTLDLEKQQADMNKVPIQPLALPDVDKSIHENMKECLSTLLDKRPAIEAQAAGFKPYDHQWKALEYAVKTIDETGKMDMVLYEKATGTGKTFVETVLCLAALASTEGTVVYLSPRIELAEQSYQAMIGFIDRFPALAESFSVSKSKILKMFSGSDAALTKNAILANQCLHPRYLMIACKDSFYNLLQEEGFREHLRLIVFDESHLTFKHEKFLCYSDCLDVINFVTFSATPFYNMPNKFCFERKEAIRKRLLAPLHIDKVPNELLRNKQGPRLAKVKKLVSCHRLPGGRLLVESKGIIFVKSQPEASALVQYLKEELPGIDCYQISSNNTNHHKELKLYRDKEVAIAVAVDMLIVGFDNSKVTWCINLKEKIKRCKRIQANGRFLRRDPSNHNKIGTIIMLKSIRKGKSIFPEGFSIPKSYRRAKDTLQPEAPIKLTEQESSRRRCHENASSGTQQVKRTCIEHSRDKSQQPDRPPERKKKRVVEAVSSRMTLFNSSSSCSSSPARPGFGRAT